MLAALTFFCFFGVFYAYFGYPILLYGLIKRRENGRIAQSTPRKPERLPKLSMIITVRNEEGVIREKLDSSLMLTYAGQTLKSQLLQENSQIELIVASDASDDGTDDVVKEYAGDGVRLVRLPERGGKEKAQRAAIAEAGGEVLVFTDAKISLHGDVLERFAAYFQDPEVGAVSSVDQVISDSGTSSGEGFYVRYEMWLRCLESQFNSLIGLSGSCFAVRREVCRDMDVHIPSDFALLIEARKRRLKGVHGADIVASYKAVRTEKEEFSRKVRTVLRGMTTFFARLEVANPFRYGAFAWQILSHKLARWLVPWFLLLGLLGCVILAPGSEIFCLLLVGALMFFAIALVGYLFPAIREIKPIKIPLFFVVVNSAIFVAWLKLMRGVRSVTWDPSAKGK